MGTPEQHPAELVLDGRLVRLRPWAADDVDAVHAACQDPDIQRWTRVPSPYHEGHARDFVAHTAGRTRELGGAAFCVQPRGTDRLVAGSIALLHQADGVGEIGYWAAPWARRRGYLREALEVLTRWCFRELGLARLELLIEPDNHPSRAVAEAAGFVEEGTLRARLLLDGHRRDVIMYALLVAAGEGSA